MSWYKMLTCFIIIVDFQTSHAKPIRGVGGRVFFFFLILLLRHALGRTENFLTRDWHNHALDAVWQRHCYDRGWNYSQVEN